MPNGEKLKILVWLMLNSWHIAEITTNLFSQQSVLSIVPEERTIIKISIL